jgi:hypothetical protein
MSDRVQVRHISNPDGHCVAIKLFFPDGRFKAVSYYTEEEAEEILDALITWGIDQRIARGEF